MEDFISLVQDARLGSVEAFTALVTRFQNMAYGYAYANLGDFDLAQDAAQEALIEAYLSLGALREPRAFPSWLKRIVFKHCDRLTRRKKVKVIPLDAAEGAACPRPGPAEAAERRELSAQVREAIRSMPGEMRAVIVLFYLGEYSHQEIADFLEVPAKTVKSRLHASRLRLRERMVHMAQEEFEHQALPEDFTHETVEQAVKRAAELNKGRRYDEAETLLRSVLVKAPEHPEAMKELNRTLMHGRVYGQGQWGLLPELAAQGKLILKTSDDEEIHRQVAQTLLAIPAMPEAISFLQDWIAEKGANLERLGMLAWAKGCSGDLAAALALWIGIRDLALESPAEETQKRLPFIAYTLVNCLSEAGEVSVAQSIARQSWEICHALAPIQPFETLINDSDWMVIWHMAKLDLTGMAFLLLQRYPESADLAEQAVRLSISGWVDDAEIVSQNWLQWVHAALASGAIDLIGKNRLAMLRGLRARNLWRQANRLAEQTWEILKNSALPGADQAAIPWDWERFSPVPAVDTRDWEAAQQLVRAEIEARGVEGAVGWAAIVHGASGTPTPPEIVTAIEENGVDGVDEYGMFGWYITARESAHAGDRKKAFDALRKALSYWSNTPYWITNLWEQDAYWGSLRGDPEFRQAFDERRQRIGTILGELHYFPGW